MTLVGEETLGMALLRLGRTGAAVPVLIQCLNDTDPDVVFEAEYALGMIHLDPVVVVPALTNLVGHSSAIVRLQAARALGGQRSFRQGRC